MPCAWEMDIGLVWMVLKTLRVICLSVYHAMWLQCLHQALRCFQFIPHHFVWHSMVFLGIVNDSESDWEDLLLSLTLCLVLEGVLNTEGVLDTEGGTILWQAFV